MFLNCLDFACYFFLLHQELARAEASSSKIMIMSDDGQPEIDMEQLQTLRQIIHSAVSRKEKVFGSDEDEPRSPGFRR
jgi:hypothetical protein